MLEAAARLGEHVEEHVALVGQAAPEALVPRATILRDVGRRARAVEHARFAFVDEVVRLAADRRTVDRRGCRRGSASRPACRSRRRGSGAARRRPAPGWSRWSSTRPAATSATSCGRVTPRSASVRNVGAPFSSAKPRLDPVGAHRHLAAVDAVGHGDARRALGLDAPAVLLRLRRRRARRRRRPWPRPASTWRCVLAHQVRARRPHRHHQLDRRLAGRGRSPRPRRSASRGRGSAGCR